MDERMPKPSDREQPSKLPYEKPLLVVHGNVGELTRSGGANQHDGLSSRRGS